MPLRQEAQFLRERARRLREIAGAHRTAVSQQLRAMAPSWRREPTNWSRADPPIVDRYGLDAQPKPPLAADRRSVAAAARAWVSVLVAVVLLWVAAGTDRAATRVVFPAVGSAGDPERADERNAPPASQQATHPDPPVPDWRP